MPAKLRSKMSYYYGLHWRYQASCSCGYTSKWYKSLEIVQFLAKFHYVFSRHTAKMMTISCVDNFTFSGEAFPWTKLK